jgi:hypothetical protein
MPLFRLEKHYNFAPSKQDNNLTTIFINKLSKNENERKNNDDGHRRLFDGGLYQKRRPV